MAIRRRLRGEKLTGYPHPQFNGYWSRFGKRIAQFLNAPMLATIGRCDPVKGKEPCLVIFMNITAVYQAWKAANEIGHEEYAEHLLAVLDGWPDSHELSIWTAHRDLANVSNLDPPERIDGKRS